MSTLPASPQRFLTFDVLQIDGDELGNSAACTNVSVRGAEEE
jgi:hypothetical protein